MSDIPPSSVATPLTPEIFVRMRESYDYFPATLVQCSDTVADPSKEIVWPGIVRLMPHAPVPDAWKNGTGRDGYSSVAVDRFHTSLFAGETDGKLLHALASTHFWGVTPRPAADRTFCAACGVPAGSPTVRCRRMLNHRLKSSLTCGKLTLTSHRAI